MSNASKLAGDLTKAQLAMIIAGGMDDRSVLKRLFSQQLESGQFPEADAIVWNYTVDHEAESLNIVFYSSMYWLNSLQEARTYQAQVV